MENIATHEAPVWGQKADFLIRADLAGHGLPGWCEQLWAHQIEDFAFEICCIPFFIYGIALGDVVETKADFTIDRVLEKSGHRTLRIAVANQEEQDELHVVLHDWAASTGLLYEWQAPGYLAVDLPPGTRVDEITPALDTLIKTGRVSTELDE